MTIARPIPEPFTTITGPDGRALTLNYDGGAGRITKVTDPIGLAVQYAYAGAGTLATERR